MIRAIVEAIEGREKEHFSVYGLDEWLQDRGWELVEDKLIMFDPRESFRQVWKWDRENLRVELIGIVDSPAVIVRGYRGEAKEVSALIRSENEVYKAKSRIEHLSAPIWQRRRERRERRTGNVR